MHPDHWPPTASADDADDADEILFMPRGAERLSQSKANLRGLHTASAYEEGSMSSSALASRQPADLKPVVPQRLCRRDIIID